MQIAGIRIRRRVFVSTGLLAAVTGVWLYWSRANQPKITLNPATPPASFVRIAGVGQAADDKVVEEQAEYFDPTPLFLPTRRNYQQGELPAGLVKPPGQVFREFEPKLNFVESSLPEYGATSEAGENNDLPEVLARGNDAPFSGFGTIDRPSHPLDRRGAHIEIKALKGGLLSISEPVNEAELPQADYYTPVEFIVAVARAGLIGEPVMIKTSGKDEIDGKLKDYLVNVYRIGQRLEPGKYLVLIGP